MERKKIKVLVVDDSTVVRKTISDILSSEADFEVMEGAVDPLVAMDIIRRQVPDVILLDVEMPRMDGITFLRRMMAHQPLPVVMCSSLATAGSELALKCLELGALEVIEKPRLGVKQFLEESKIRICDAVRAASRANLMTVGRAKPVNDQPRPVRATSSEAPPPASKGTLPAESVASTPSDLVIAVGASTGGTEALRTFLSRMPAEAPGIVVVQHMPGTFTAGFARRLDENSAMKVKEAEDGDTVTPGHVLLAPGNMHMFLKRTGSRYFVEVKEGPFINRHRPSVDVLFKSAARFAGRNAVGVIMTGMGSDGALGLLEMKKAGARTIAQNEDTCVVYGMPQEAVNSGAVDRVEALDDIAGAVMEEAASIGK